jgi:hypothetical protein
LSHKKAQKAQTHLGLCLLCFLWLKYGRGRESKFLLR